MTPAKSPHEFFSDAQKNRRKKLNDKGFRKKLSKKEILKQHIERQSEVINYLIKRSDTLKSRHEKIMHSITGLPITAITEFKTHFAKYNDAYSDFLATTKKDSVGLTDLETLDLVLKNAIKTKELDKKEKLIKYYEVQRIWLDSKLTTLGNAEQELIKVLMTKGILQKSDFK